MKRVIQITLAIFALLSGLVFGPETHVHPGEGQSREAIVHVHFGSVGHVHRTRSRPSFSDRDAEGPAVYLNVYSSVATHGLGIPNLIAVGFCFLAPSDTGIGIPIEPEVRAHAPPLIGPSYLRPPPPRLV